MEKIDITREKLDKTRLTIIRTIILLMCGLIIPVSLFAQDIRAGIKGGMNFSNFASLDNVDDQRSRTGFHVGAFAQLPISDGFAIQPEILFDTKGTIAEYNVAGFEGEARHKLSYIDIPLLGVFKLGETAEIHVGPYVGFMLNSKLETDISSGSYDSESDFKTLDYGLAAGFALNFNTLSVGTRYNLGLTKINDSEVSDAILSEVRNSLAQVYVAISLSD